MCRPFSQEVVSNHLTDSIHGVAFPECRHQQLQKQDATITSHLKKPDDDASTLEQSNEGDGQLNYCSVGSIVGSACNEPW